MVFGAFFSPRRPLRWAIISPSRNLISERSGPAKVVDKVLEVGEYLIFPFASSIPNKSLTTSINAFITLASGATKRSLYLSNNEESFLISPRAIQIRHQVTTFLNKVSSNHLISDFKTYLFIGITKYLTELSDTPLMTIGRPMPAK